MSAFPIQVRAAAAAALSVASFASVSPAAAMVGTTGVAGSASRYTVMVLFRQGTQAGFCSGVALAQDVVLTAAHCLPKGADVRIHLPGTDGKPKLLPVSAVALSPEYRPDAIKQRERSIDLALVHLPKPLPDFVSPASLARSGGTTLGSRFVASGFGVAREGDAPSSGTLRSAVLVARAPLSGVLLWAEDPAKAGTGACTGDSGGPVSLEGNTDVQALMVWSAGDGTQQCGSLTQAAWLAPQRAWIDRVMQAWAAGR